MKFDRSQVSIRASRAGGDPSFTWPANETDSFNPRLPRGRRLATSPPRLDVSLFQSAPPAREATCNASGSIKIGPVSIRASRAGGDPKAGASLPAQGWFQSAPPAREATPSIRSSLPTPQSFNPRLPRGRRPAASCCWPSSNRFQSAPPAREATAGDTPLQGYGQVSIRASRAGGDPACRRWGARPIVSIRASRAGGDHGRGGGKRDQKEFQSAPPAREATA